MAVHQTIIFVLVVVIACNVVLYPSLFSTIFQQWFGWSSPPQKEQPDPVPDYPPHLRGRMPPGSRPSQFPSGKDASAYMAKHGQEGGGRGMMGTILPVYAVGIFIYFGYVIYKIFLKEKPGSAAAEQDPWNRDADPLGPSLERQQEENLQRQLAAELRAANYDGMQGYRRRKTRERTEAEPAPSSTPRENDEVDILKKRLEQTEQTMDKMMEMMSNMGVAFNQVTEQLKTKPQGKKKGGRSEAQEDVPSEDEVDEDEADEDEADEDEVDEDEADEDEADEDEADEDEADEDAFSSEEDERAEEDGSEDSLPGLEDIAPKRDEDGEILVEEGEDGTMKDVKSVQNKEGDATLRRRTVGSDEDAADN